MINTIVKGIIILLFGIHAIKELSKSENKEWWLNLFTLIVIVGIIVYL